MDGEGMEQGALKETVANLIKRFGGKQVFQEVNRQTKTIGRGSDFDASCERIIIRAAGYCVQTGAAGESFRRAAEELGEEWDKDGTVKARLMRRIHKHVFPESFDDYSQYDDAILEIQFSMDAKRRSKQFEEYLASYVKKD